MRAILFLSGLLFCSLAFSQLKRGTVLVSGNSNLGAVFGSYKEKSQISEDPKATKTFNMNIQPKMGLFVARKMALGVMLDWRLGNTKSPVDEKINNSEILFGPFVRYYLETGSRELKFFAEASGGIGNRTVTSSENSNDNEDFSVFFMNAGPGMAYFITDRISLDLSVDYRWKREADKNSDTEQRTIYKNFGFNLGFSLIL